LSAVAAQLVEKLTNDPKFLR